MSMIEIGNRIFQRRKQLGLTQVQLARQMGFARETISNWERGTRQILAEDIPVLTKALRVSPNYLFGEIEYKADGKLPQLVAFYDDMTPEAQDDLLDLALSMWKRKRKSEPVLGRKAEDGEDDTEE